MLGASSLKITGCLGSEGATAKCWVVQAPAHSHTHTHKRARTTVTLNGVGKHVNFNQRGKVLSSFVTLTVSW